MYMYSGSKLFAQKKNPYYSFNKMNSRDFFLLIRRMTQLESVKLDIIRHTITLFQYQPLLFVWSPNLVLLSS